VLSSGKSIPQRGGSEILNRHELATRSHEGANGRHSVPPDRQLLNRSSEVLAFCGNGEVAVVVFS
jgi:hypothetical protein